MNGIQLVRVAMVGLCLCPGAAVAQHATALVREGDLIGDTGETAANLGSVAVGYNGAYGVSFARLPSITSLLWGSADGGPPGVLREEALIGNFQQTTLEFFFGFADDGRICYSAVCDEIVGGGVSLDSIWIDDTPILMRNQLIPTLNRFADYCSRPGITADGKPYWHSGLSDSPGQSSTERALLFDTTMTPLVTSGDPIPGTTEFVRLGNPFDIGYRFSKFGTNWIVKVYPFGATGLSSGIVLLTGQPIMLDGVLMQDGQPVPASVGGVFNETWADFDQFGVTESGSWLVLCETTALAPANWLLMKDGRVELRGGQAVADGRTLTGDIEEAYLNENGDWAATWTVLDGGSPREVLLVNGAVVLQAGDAVDFDGDGTVDPAATISDFTGSVSLAISDRDSAGRIKIYTTADIDTLGTPALNDDTEAFLVFEVALGGGGCVCEADGDHAQVNVFDLLAYLDDWFAGAAAADIDGEPGVNVFDLLAFLDCWFPASAGTPCP